MNRPRLRHPEPNLYLTEDGAFRIRRAELPPGPRGGRRQAWQIEGDLNGIPREHPTLTAAALALLPRLRYRSGLDPESGTVYLLHFDRPFGHARHYLGWTNAESVEERVRRHHSGQGARLLQHVLAAGIDFRLVRVWPGGRLTERRFKRAGSSVRLCPVCLPGRRARRRERRNPEGRRLERGADGRYRSAPPQPS